MKTDTLFISALLACVCWLGVGIVAICCIPLLACVIGFCKLCETNFAAGMGAIMLMVILMAALNSSVPLFIWYIICTVAGVDEMITEYFKS